MTGKRVSAGPARRPIAFISHHSSQEATARHLKSVLERNGVTGWMAPDDIEPGLPFDRAIVDQVKRSDMIILLFCAQSDRSKHVKRELMLAEDQDKLIYPVRLEAIEPTGLAYWLQDYQWIDWVDRRDATIERLIQTVKRQVADADAVAARAAASEIAAPERSASASGELEAPTRQEKADTQPSPPLPPPASSPPPNTPAPAAASPSAIAPVALMGKPGGGDGGKHGEAAPPAPRGGLGRGGVIAIGVAIALLLVLAASFALGAFGSVGPADGEEFVVEPGLWDTRVAVSEIITPMDDAARAETISGLERDSYTESCVSEETARDPDVAFFDPEGEGNCTLGDFEMADGEYAGHLLCEPSALDGGEAELDFTGSYGADFADTEAEVTIRYNDGGELRYRATYRSSRIGDCS